MSNPGPASGGPPVRVSSGPVLLPTRTEIHLDGELLQAVDDAVNGRTTLGTGPAIAVIDPLVAGCAADARHVTDASVAAGTLNQISSVAAGPLWQSVSPIGKVILLSDQGAGDSDLWATVTAFDGVQTITVNTPAKGASNGQMLAWGTNDTAIMDGQVFSQQAANPGSVIQLPLSGMRRFMYNGVGLQSANPAMRGPILIGQPQFYLGPLVSLVTSPIVAGNPVAIGSLDVNVYTYGGTHPGVRLTYTGANSSFSSYRAIVQAEYFRGSVVSSLASDHPYWKIKVTARNPLTERGFGVALAGYTDACEIQVDCLKLMAGYKLGRGGNSARVGPSSFIHGAWNGTPRICGWHVPETTAVNSGRDFDAYDQRWPNEGYDNRDFRVLIADEDPATGADFASRTPSWLPSVNWSGGLRYRDSTVTGNQNNGNLTNGPVFYSTTPLVYGFKGERISINSTPPAIAFQYLNIPSIANNASGPTTMTNRLLDWSSEAGSGTVTPRVTPSNDPGWLVRDPSHVFETQNQTFMGGGNLGPYSKLTGRIRTGGALSPEWTQQPGSVGPLSFIPDLMGQGGAVTFTFNADFDGLIGSLANPIANAPIWIDFDLRGSGATPLAQLLVTLETDNATPEWNRWFITVPSSWRSYRLFHPGLRPDAAIPSHTYLRFKTIGMAAGTADIGRVHCYHGTEPFVSRFQSPVAAINPPSGTFVQGATSISTGAPPIGSLRLIPVAFAEDKTLSELFFEVTAAGSADSTVTLCMYNDTGDLYPSDLVWTMPAIAAATVGMKEPVGPTPFNVRAGTYWAGALILGTTAPSVRTGYYGVNNDYYNALPPVGNTSVAYQATGLAALPAFFPTLAGGGGTVSNAARVGIKAA